VVAHATNLSRDAINLDADLEIFSGDGVLGGVESRLDAADTSTTGNLMRSAVESTVLGPEVVFST
jgi:hypothetical protein